MTQGTPSGADFYKSLEDLLEFCERRASDEGTDCPSLTIWLGEAYNSSRKTRLHFDIHNNRYGTEKVSVEGVDLVLCMDEYIRRCQFARRQSTLAIGSAVIEEPSAILRSGSQRHSIRQTRLRDSTASSLDEE